MGQIEVIPGIERRRRWSEEEKKTLVAAAFSPDGSVTAVARSSGIHGSQIYKWRRELQDVSSGFAEVVRDPRDHSHQRIEVVIDQRIVASIPHGASPDLVAAMLRALVRR